MQLATAASLPLSYQLNPEDSAPNTNDSGNNTEGKPLVNLANTMEALENLKNLSKLYIYDFGTKENATLDELYDWDVNLDDETLQGLMKLLKLQPNQLEITGLKGISKRNIDSIRNQLGLPEPAESSPTFFKCNIL